MTGVIFPKDITQEISAKFQNYFDAPYTKINSLDFKWARLKNDVDKLKKVNPKQVYMLRGTIHALEGDIEAMNADFKIAEQQGIDKGILFHNKLMCLEYNGLFDEMLSILKDIDFKHQNGDIGFLLSASAFASQLSMGKVLENSLNTLLHLNYTKDNKMEKLINHSKCLSKVDERITSSIMSEVRSFLHKNEIDLNDQRYHYDDEQEILFAELSVSPNDKHPNIFDFDTELQFHLINFAIEKKINGDKFIISLTPYPFKPFSELRGQND